jgi:peptidoglycan/LPS O-acetylase OafA/YrhL
VSETTLTKPQTSTSGARPGKGPIPYLDGLRAYSILNVLLNHSIEYGHATRLLPWLGTRWAEPFRIVFADGGLGVRVFFALSGFLITSMLLDELDATGRISITGFYAGALQGFFRPRTAISSR